MKRTRSHDELENERGGDPLLEQSNKAKETFALLSDSWPDTFVVAIAAEHPDMHYPVPVPMQWGWISQAENVVRMRIEACMGERGSSHGSAYKTTQDGWMCVSVPGSEFTFAPVFKMAFGDVDTAMLFRDCLKWIAEHNTPTQDPTLRRRCQAGVCAMTRLIKGLDQFGL